ncbi:hypothetical protein ACWDAZ_14445 [Streptomyces sp. NPDC001215]
MGGASGKREEGTGGGGVPGRACRSSRADRGWAAVPRAYASGAPPGAPDAGAVVPPEAGADDRGAVPPEAGADDRGAAPPEAGAEGREPVAPIRKGRVAAPGRVGVSTGADPPGAPFAPARSKEAGASVHGDAPFAGADGAEADA